MAMNLDEFENLPDTAGMDIIDAMLAEHDRILEEADDFERMCLALMTTDAFDLASYLRKVRFIRAYADASHHKKEEDVLYSYMVTNLGRIAENLIQHGMLVEHDAGRMATSKIEQAAQDYAADPTDEHKLELLSWSMEYVHLIRRHVQKENDVVYPFARRSLSAEVLADLSSQANAYDPRG